MKVEGEDQKKKKDQKSLFEGWEELYPFLSNECSLPSFQLYSSVGKKRPPFSR